MRRGWIGLDRDTILSRLAPGVRRLLDTGMLVPLTHPFGRYAKPERTEAGPQRARLPEHSSSHLDHLPWGPTTAVDSVKINGHVGRPVVRVAADGANRVDGARLSVGVGSAVGGVEGGCGFVGLMVSREGDVPPHYRVVPAVGEAGSDGGLMGCGILGGGADGVAVRGEQEQELLDRDLLAVFVGGIVGAAALLGDAAQVGDGDGVVPGPAVVVAEGSGGVVGPPPATSRQGSEQGGKQQGEK